MVLAAMISSGIQGAKASAVRLQCLANIRSLGQAALIYADSNPIGRVPDGGHQPSGAFTYSNNAALGTLYDPRDFNDLSLFICPMRKKSAGQPTYNSANKTISPPYSYFFVRGRFLDSTSAIQVEPQLNSYPASNILLLEDPNNTIHAENGFSVFQINGKARFQKTPWPVNKLKDGTDDNANISTLLYSQS